MRLLVFACLALVATACRHAVPPSGFGVDLTIDGTKLTARANVTTITITGTGAEPYFSGPIAAASQIGKSGVLRVRYVPGVDSGSLAFSVDALDATGTIAGTAQSPAVMLVAGHAVDLTLVLADPVVVPVDMAQADLAPATCGNGMLDPGETDVDCGGVCPRCEPGKLCGADTDCATHTCLLTGAGDMAVRRCELASSPPFWTSLPDLPTAISAPGAVGTSDGSIYAVGGVTTTIVASTLSLSLATNAWTATGSMSVPRAGMPVIYAANKLFAIGGETVSGTTRSALASIESFDPTTGVWSPVMRHLGIARALHSGALGGDHLVYAFGGVNYPDFTALGLVADFDPTMDANTTLDTVTPLPVARYGMAGATDAAGHVLAIGGLTTAGTVTTAYDEVDVYDTAGKTWTPGPSLGVARGAVGVTRGADGRIYAVGGSLSSTVNSATVEAYGPRIVPGPPQGPIGTTVAIAGTNFAANATVTINVSNGTTTTLATTGTTNVNGTLTPSPVWKVTSAFPPGTYVLTASDDRSRYQVQTSFEVK